MPPGGLEDIGAADPKAAQLHLQMETRFQHQGSGFQTGFIPFGICYEDQ